MLEKKGERKRNEYGAENQGSKSGTEMPANVF